jgi:hypothetical protein
MNLTDTRPTLPNKNWNGERTTLRHRPLYPKLHCAKAIQFFRWRPDHPGCPPTAHAIGPLLFLSGGFNRPQSDDSVPAKHPDVNKMAPKMTPKPIQELK